MTIIIFLSFVGFVLGLSFWLGRQTKSASSYFAAGGEIPWFVNGIAFAGDYLSAASFLGICGMIAFLGYDGFLYSIGYLAGWVVALFVVAEPMKRLGRYTFTDALDSTFNNKGIRLAAGISTIIVSICYLIPQMVGAGVLVEPLLGMPHHWGVIMVGAVVIYIVATAGMKSTTYVQFLKGAMLIVFSFVITVVLCMRGISDSPEMIGDKGQKIEHYSYRTIEAALDGENLVLPEGAGDMRVSGMHVVKDSKTGIEQARYYMISEIIPLNEEADGRLSLDLKGLKIHLSENGAAVARKLLMQKADSDKIMINGKAHVYEDINGRKVLVLHDGNMTDADGHICMERDGRLFDRLDNWWKATVSHGRVVLQETQSLTKKEDGAVIINGAPKSEENYLRHVGRLSKVAGKTGAESVTGPVGPIKFLSIVGDKDTVVERWTQADFKRGNDFVSVFYSVPTPGPKFLRPGLKFKVEGTLLQKLDFISLMLALFFGTAALPHILIRYYTVKSTACARKSTIVAIAAIGTFYILTMYLGLGALTSGALNPADNNMSAPLLARAMSNLLFAIISAIAFSTVLGTVSGLIVAASGAVAHDLLDRYFALGMSDKTKVFTGKLAAFTVGLLAIILGIVFKGMNVSFLVGWAFAVAASANLPAIIMVLFWKRTTAKGIVASIVVGIVASLGLIMLSPDMYVKYGLRPETALIPINQPGIISIPLSFMTLVIVSLVTGRKKEA